MPSKKSTQCTAKTKRGTRCRNQGTLDPSTGSMRCYAHNSTAASKPKPSLPAYKPLPSADPSSLSLPPLGVQTIPKKNRLIVLVQKVLRTCRAIQAHVGSQWRHWSLEMQFIPIPNMKLVISYTCNWYDDEPFFMEVKQFRPSRNYTSSVMENDWTLKNRLRVVDPSDFDALKNARWLILRPEVEALLTAPATFEKTVDINVMNLAGSQPDAEAWAKAIHSLLDFPKTMTPFQFAFVHEHDRFVPRVFEYAIKN